MFFGLQGLTLCSFREAMLLHKLEHTNILQVEAILRDVQVPGTNNVANFLVMPFMEFDLEYVMSDQVCICEYSYLKLRR